ncbi:hypothetical protein N3Z16_09265 (plasmid) [Candidatus Megaera polyxenophila]|nr:hypothetical protein N3Z16_09265 [Candidatus Megaera polyxenophila]
MMLPHHGALDKLKLFHLEDGGFHHQRDYKYKRFHKSSPKLLFLFVKIIIVRILISIFHYFHLCTLLIEWIITVLHYLILSICIN